MIHNGRLNINVHAALPVHLICADGDHLYHRVAKVLADGPRQAVDHAISHEPPLLCPGAVLCHGTFVEIRDAYGPGHLFLTSLQETWEPPTNARILIPADGDRFPCLILSYWEITYLHDRDEYPSAVDYRLVGDSYRRIDPSIQDGPTGRTI